MCQVCNVPVMGCSRALGQEAGCGEKVVSRVSAALWLMGTRKENFHLGEYHTHPSYVKQVRQGPCKNRAELRSRNKIT